MLTVQNLMTKKVISVLPETSVIEAANILTKYNLSGVPVVDGNNVLSGILTEYDLVIKGSMVHLPTFIKLFSQFDLYKKDKNLVKGDLKKIFDMQVKDIMNSEPLVLSEDATVEEAFRAFSEHHRVNPIPVINREKKVVGVVSRYDLNKFFRSSGFYLENAGNKERNIDKEINLFLNSFEKQFIFVSKARTHLWLITSILFAILGYIIAWAWILRLR